MSVLVTALAALGGALLFELLRVPAGAMMGALVGVAALRLGSNVTVELAGPVKFVIYVMVGWALAEGISREALTTLRSIAVPVALSVIGLLLVSGVFAYLISRTAGLDAPTAFLSMAPGGIAHMGIIGADADANVGVVVGVHTVRVLSIVLLTPWIARALPT